MTTYGAARLAAGAAACLCALGPAAYGDSGVVDVEVPNGTRLLGTLVPAAEQETVRIQVPPGAELDVLARGRGRGAPTVQLRLFDETGEELRPDGGLAIPGGVQFRDVAIPTPGLVRIEVRGDGRAAGDYLMTVRWSAPRSVAISGSAATSDLVVPFTGEAGGTAIVSVRPAARGGAPPESVVLAGAGDDGVVVPLRRGVARVALPATGAFSVRIPAGATSVPLKGRILVRPPRGRPRIDVRERNRDVREGRFVGRTVGPAGAVVAVPLLDEAQIVSVDIAGASVEVPEDTVGVPTPVVVRATDDLDPGTRSLSPAGAAVEYDTGSEPLAGEIMLNVPFDSGAASLGGGSVVVLTRDDDGNVSEVIAPTTVDVEEGTAGFPTAHTSAYQVFVPQLELVGAGSPDAPIDVDAAADGTVYVAEAFTGRVLRRPPGGGALEAFAGGGLGTADGTPRLDFRLGFVDAVAAAPDGSVLVAAHDAGSFGGRIYRVGTDDLVTRIAGDGSGLFPEGAVARDAGLPLTRALAAGADGDVFALTDEFSRTRVVRIAALDGTITTVAGRGDFAEPGVHPLDAEIYFAGALLVDSQGRLLVGVPEALVRFDLATQDTELLAGLPELFQDGGVDGGPSGPVTLAGRGAPLRSVSFGLIEDLAFDPADEDVVYVADAIGGLIWRLDLARNRAFAIAGRQLSVEASVDVNRADPRAEGLATSSPLEFPFGVAVTGGQVFIAEFSADRLSILRQK